MGVEILWKYRDFDEHFCMEIVKFSGFTPLERIDDQKDFTSTLQKDRRNFTKHCAVEIRCELLLSPFKLVAIMDAKGTVKVVVWTIEIFVITCKKFRNTVY